MYELVKPCYAALNHVQEAEIVGARATYAGKGIISTLKPGNQIPVLRGNFEQLPVSVPGKSLSIFGCQWHPLGILHNFFSANASVDRAATQVTLGDSDRRLRSNTLLGDNWAIICSTISVTGRMVSIFVAGIAM
jgi:hypothetical protein